VFRLYFLYHLIVSNKTGMSQLKTVKMLFKNKHLLKKHVKFYPPIREHRALYV